jgi:hypothetical protein
VVVCPACGKENPDGFAFCGFCSAPLAAPARALAEERKVVSVLFCDLVGFTASSESADPEDVDRMLSAYAEMARQSARPRCPSSAIFPRDEERSGDALDSGYDRRFATNRIARR